MMKIVSAFDLDLLLFFSFLKASAQEAFTKAGKGLAEQKEKDQKKEDRKLKLSLQLWKVDRSDSDHLLFSNPAPNSALQQWTVKYRCPDGSGRVERDG